MSSKTNHTRVNQFCLMKSDWTILFHENLHQTTRELMEQMNCDETPLNVLRSEFEATHATHPQILAFSVRDFCTYNLRFQFKPLKFIVFHYKTYNFKYFSQFANSDFRNMYVIFIFTICLTLKNLGRTLKWYTMIIWLDFGRDLIQPG